MPIIRSRGGRRSTRRVIPGRGSTTMTRRTSRRAYVPRLSKPLARAVQSIVKRNVETKYVTYAAENNIAHNSAIGAGDQYRLIPQIFSGTDDNQRMGDRVAPQSLYVRGMVSLVTPALSTKPIMVRVLALQLKGMHLWAAATQAWGAGAVNSLLKYNTEGIAGAATNAAFTGTQQDLYQPVNRDVFDVLGERYIKLDGSAVGAIEAASINTLAKNFNMKIRCPKSLKYSSSTATLPENFAPFLSVGYAYMDGTAPDVVSTQVIVNAFAHLYYKDA